MLWSLAMTSGLVGIIILSTFLVSLISFSLRTHGPLGAMRFEQLISTFPWGAVVTVIISMGLGVWLMKKYDFSYKKNFPLIVIGFVLAIILAGWLINYTGLDRVWMRKGPMREFYQKYDGRMRRGQPWRIMPTDNYNQPGSPIRGYKMTR